MGNWLNNTQPTQNYYITTIDGRRGEAGDLAGIFELLIEPKYFEIEEESAKAVTWIRLLNNVAVFLVQNGIKADVYDGLGRVFSNYAGQEGDLEFFDDDPVILDAWNEETTLASLIRIGYLDIYVKDDSLQGYQIVEPGKLEGALTPDYKPPFQRGD